MKKSFVLIYLLLILCFSSRLCMADPIFHFHYDELPDGTLEITGCSDPTGYITIPEVINGKTVTSIGHSAFFNCDDLIHVSLPETITVIDYDAFSWCDNLSNVDLPDNLSYLGDYAFANCDSITSFYIPKSLTVMGFLPFSGKNLTHIEVEQGNPVFEVIDGMLIDWQNKRVITSESNISEAHIPDGIQIIEGFDNSNLRSVYLPDSLTRIAYCAFLNCENLTHIDLPHSLESIEALAFSGCSNLTSIQLPNSLTSIDESAFEDYYNERTGSHAMDIMLIVEEGTYAEQYAIANGFNYTITASIPQLPAPQLVNMDSNNLFTFASAEDVLFQWTPVANATQYKISIKDVTGLSDEEILAPITDAPSLFPNWEDNNFVYSSPIMMNGNVVFSPSRYATLEPGRLYKGCIMASDGGNEYADSEGPVFRFYVEYGSTSDSSSKAETGETRMGNMPLTSRSEAAEYLLEQQQTTEVASTSLRGMPMGSRKDFLAAMAGNGGNIVGEDEYEVYYRFTYNDGTRSDDMKATDGSIYVDSSQVGYLVIWANTPSGKHADPYNYQYDAHFGNANDKKDYIYQYSQDVLKFSDNAKGFYLKGTEGVDSVKILLRENGIFNQVIAKVDVYVSNGAEVPSSIPKVFFTATSSKGEKTLIEDGSRIQVSADGSWNNENALTFELRDDKRKIILGQSDMISEGFWLEFKNPKRDFGNQIAWLSSDMEFGCQSFVNQTYEFTLWYKKNGVSTKVYDFSVAHDVFEEQANERYEFMVMWPRGMEESGEQYAVLLDNGFIQLKSHWGNLAKASTLPAIWIYDRLNGVLINAYAEGIRIKQNGTGGIWPPEENGGYLEHRYEGNVTLTMEVDGVEQRDTLEIYCDNEIVDYQKELDLLKATIGFNCTPSGKNDYDTILKVYTNYASLVGFAEHPEYFEVGYVMESQHYGTKGQTGGGYAVVPVTETERIVRILGLANEDHEVEISLDMNERAVISVFVRYRTDETKMAFIPKNEEACSYANLYWFQEAQQFNWRTENGIQGVLHEWAKKNGETPEQRDMTGEISALNPLEKGMLSATKSFSGVVDVVIRTAEAIDKSVSQDDYDFLNFCETVGLLADIPKDLALEAVKGSLGFVTGRDSEEFKGFVDLSSFIWEATKAVTDGEGVMYVLEKLNDSGKLVLENGKMYVRYADIVNIELSSVTDVKTYQMVQNYYTVKGGVDGLGFWIDKDAVKELLKIID